MRVDRGMGPLRRLAMICKWLPVAIAIGLTTSAAADVVCPDSSYCQVSFATSKEWIRIVPGSGGETFAAAGITIAVYLKDCSGAPLVGVPSQDILLSNSNLCVCPEGNVADAATDGNGRTTFTGSLRAGGCVQSLQVVAQGVAIGTIPVKTRSPDHIPLTPCSVDGDDLGLLAGHLGNPNGYIACLDYDDSGVIDISDLVFWASFRGTNCPRSSADVVGETPDGAPGSPNEPRKP
jgi:hypothetical protein